jgi:hypothetical protein
MVIARVAVLATVGLAVAFAPRSAPAQAPVVRAIVTTGQPAPGGGVFERFAVEAQPVVVPVNSRGQVAFFASLSRSRAGEGVFLASAGQIVKVALAGDRAPGGGVFSGFARHPVPSLNDAGAVAFAASLAGGRAVEGIFVFSGGRLRTVALTGAASPAVPGGTFAALDLPAIGDGGDVAFVATVRRGRETVEALYVERRRQLRKLVAQGDPAPEGGAFAAFGAPAMNARGAIAFAALVEGRAAPGGIFVADGGRVHRIVAAGDESPVGGIFAKLSDRVGLNEAGTVAFTAVLKDAPTARGVFVADPGGEHARVRAVATLGEAAPGGGVFSNVGLWPALDRGGAVAFTAAVDGGPHPLAAFLIGGRDRVLAAVGDTLPGGGVLASFGLSPVVSMSATGAVTFAAVPTATGEGAEGLFLVAP